MNDKEMTELKDGEPCSHPGCLLHVAHPCEGCGRVSGRTLPKKMTDAELVEEARQKWPGSKFIENVIKDLLDGVNSTVTRDVLESLLNEKKSAK